METLFQDLRYAVRVMVKSPVLSALAILSLALGIGANTTIFSLANALLLQTLPVSEPARLINLYTTDKKNPDGLSPMSHLNWKDYREQADLFEGILGYNWIPLSLRTTGEPVRVFAHLASGNYFDVLGVKAARGRTFGPAEDEVPGRDPVVVLSHGFWTKHAGADPGIVGRTLTLNAAAFTVLGVMPESFNGVDVGVRPEVWVPMAMNQQVQTGTNWYDQRRGLFIFSLGRLKPGVSKEQAQAQLTTIAERLEREYPNDNKDRSVTVVPLAQASINPNARQGVLAATGLLMTVVGLVLLIACANVSNLLLGRALARRREIAVRLAIGASRRRLVRQLLTESIALALPAAALGVLIAYWARGALLALLPAFPVSLTLTLDLDWRVLAFTLIVGVVSGVLFGMLPALQASKPDVVEALKDTDRTGGPARHRFGIREFLVVGQVALSLIALVGAGLFLRSLAATARTDPGFETKMLLSVNFDLGLQGYSREKGDAFLRLLDERLRSTPGVVSAATASNGPLAFNISRTVFLEGGTDNDRTMINVPDLPLTALSTVEKTIADSLWAPRAGASLLGLFGLLALLLAAVGMYSVMCYSVSQRQREIGIRMALGAGRSDVLRMVMGRGMTVVAVGLAVGLAVSFALARLAAGMLVGVSAWDAVSFGGAALLLTAVAFAANFFPTRRAAGTDPTVALRYQ